MTTTDRRQGLRTGQGLKAPCVVASTAALTLSGEQTIDGIAVGSAQRVLVKDQADLKENGIYDVGPTAWSRSKDFDGDGDAIPGTAVYVDRGANGGGKFYAINSSATSTSVVITTFVSSDADDKVWSLLSVALAGVSVFSQDTLFPLGTAAAWRSSDGLNVRSATDTIALSEISAGTAGTIVAYSSTGQLGEVAVGTSGQVLTGNGAGLPPTFQALSTASTAVPGVIEIATTAETLTGTDADRAVTPAGLKAVNLQEFIDQQSASNSAQIDIVWTSTEYEKVIIIIDDLDPATNDVELRLRTSADGVAFDSGASDYAWHCYGIGSVSLVPDTSAAADHIQCLGEQGANNGIGNNGHLEITIYRPNNPGANTDLSGTGGYVGGVGGIYSGGFSGRRATDGAVQGVRFFASSGNLTTGVFTAWGIKI